MSRRRCITFTGIVLLLELVLMTGIIIFKEHSDTDTAASRKKASVIEGNVIDASEAADGNKNKTDGMQGKRSAQAEEDIASEEQLPADAGQSQEALQAESGSSDTGRESIEEIQNGLQNLVQTDYQAGGRAAICTGRTDENDMALVGGGAMQAASLIKLYVAGCVYENYEAVSAQDSYEGETESLLSVMITVSDNTACNTLVSRLGNGDVQAGMAKVNQYCTSHGFSDTHMGRLMLQPNDADENYTSVYDCCRYLKMADAGQLEGASLILGYMKQQQRRGKIPAGVPSGITVGNKTGELSDVENDAAIVYGNNGTYVLCVMSENLSDNYGAQRFITRTSGMVYEYMEK